MQLPQQFNAQQYDPTQTAGGLPIGQKMPVIINGSEVEGNKAGTGGFVRLDLLIIDGPNKGATGSMRFNLYHTNPQAVEIAHKQFSAVCHVTRVFLVQDLQQLHNIPFLVDVAAQKDAQYTEVKKVYDIQGNEPGKPPQAAAAPAPQQFAPQAPVQAAPAPVWGAPAPQAPPQQPAQAPAWQQPAAPAQPAYAPPPWAVQK